MSKVAFAAAVAVLVAAPAGAHVTLENRQASVSSYYKAVFAVPHGCAGSPTVKIRVQIPEGVIGVKPMPKPGWNLDMVKGKYAVEYENHGRKVSEGVKEVIWSGGSLPDDWYDEFVVRGTFSADLDTTAKFYIPVVQECEKGADRWIEIPAAGKSADDYEFPAPGLQLLPKK